MVLMRRSLTLCIYSTYTKSPLAYARHMIDYMKKSKAIFSNQSIARNDMKWKKHIEKIARNIQNLEFYTRPSDSNLESMLVHLGYRDDGTPFITLWKDGLSEMAI